MKSKGTAYSQNMRSVKIFRSLYISMLVMLLGCSADPEPGADGLVSLVKVTQETAGTNCATGGFKIETGIDNNRNGILDAGEVQNFVYICNGASGTSGTNGTNGTNGLTSLIKVSIEPAGVNCTEAGYRVDTGVDDNANGILDAVEIDNTFYICSGSLVNYGKHTLILAGNVTDEEAAQIIARDLGTATQEIYITQCSNLTTVDLSKLETAISIQIINNSALKTINLGGLKSVASVFTVNNLPELENLNLNSLEEYRGVQLGSGTIPLHAPNFSITEVEKLTQLSFPSLVTIDWSREEGEGRLYIRGDELISLSLPELAEGNIEVISPNLVSFSAPKLTKGDVYIYSTSLTSLSLPELTEGSIAVGSSNLASFSAPKLTKGYVGISGSFTSLSLPELAEGGIGISDSPGLTSVALPKLKVLWGLQITDNPNLASLTLPTLTAFEDEGGYSFFNIQGCKLSSVAVNSILANLVQITPAITSRDITLQMNPAAPPTGQGITDKNTLVANGNNVTTD